MLASCKKFFCVATGEDSNIMHEVRTYAHKPEIGDPLSTPK